MKIVLCGRGAMAAAIREACATESIPVIEFKSDAAVPDLGDDAVGIYVSSGNNLLDFLRFCEIRQIPLIQGATRNLPELPPVPKTVIVNAPNLALPMIVLLGVIGHLKPLCSIGMAVRIEESHQAGKEDVSGTARVLAAELEVPGDWIQKIRDPERQRSIGVPEEYLGGHAYHDVVFSGLGMSEIRISTRVHGRGAYAQGAIVIAQKLLLTRELRPSIYGITRDLGFVRVP